MIERDQIRKKLLELSDEKYRKFHCSLCPNKDGIMGVRVPILRNYAKELYNNNRIDEIKLGDDYYEELVIQGMLIGFQTKILWKEAEKQIKEFVPKINSWAVCDTFCAGLKITKKHEKEMYNLIKMYLKSNEEYEVRFAVVMILDYYIKPEYIDEVLKLLEIKSDKYYIEMAVAWAYSVCLVKQYYVTLKFLMKANINDFTYNKTLQKAIESYRITKEKKAYLRTLKR